MDTGTWIVAAVVALVFVILFRDKIFKLVVRRDGVELESQRSRIASADRAEATDGGKIDVRARAANSKATAEGAKASGKGSKINVSTEGDSNDPKA